MLSPGICSKTSHQDGWVTSCPWVSGNPSPLGSYFLAASWTWQATPVFLPGKSHGERSLVGYSPWGREESDTTDFTFTGKEKQVWVLVWHIPPPSPSPHTWQCCLPQPHVRYVQLGQVPKVASLLLLKARWAHSIFLWVYHLAAVFVPSTGLEDNTVHTKVLTKFTQQALNDSQKSLSLSNIEMSLTRKAVP